MKIHSGRMGEVEIDPARIITIPDGIIGFPDFKRYIELEFLDDSPLQLFQAVDEPDLAFIMIDPLLFQPDYSADITSDDLKSLNAHDPAELLVRVIVTVPEDPYEMTANLQGPLVINPESGLGRQIINQDRQYTTRHKVLTRVIHDVP